MSSDDALRVVACVIRREVTVDLGISFRQDVVNGCLVIDSLASDGLFAKTGLKLDMFLLKINGHKCYRISKEKLDKTETMLKQAKGIVTIEALSPARIILNEPQINERQVFSIQKASPNFQLGLGLEKIQTPEDSLRVVKVSPTFQKILGLKQGLELISVNGAPCDVNDIDGVQTHMKDAFPMISLECVATVKNTMYKKEKEGLAAAPEPKEEKEDVDENVKVVACVLRREAFLELGIDFRRDVENGFLIIDTVSKDGLFANTGLKPNQRVLKINGHRISRKRLDQAVEVLQNAKGLITIEAHSFVKNAPEEGSKIEKQIFSIQKATKAFQLGLGLEKIQTPEDTLRIVKVSPTFQKVLGLTPGLQLVKVNGVDCDVNNIASVEEQMSKAFPMLSLECQATIVIKKNEKEENDDDDENIRVVACIVRPQSDLPLGLTYHPDSENGHLVIDSVDPHGFFAKSGMKPGLHIMRVNGKRISQKNLDQAVDILKTIKGWVTLEAELTRNPEKFVERRFYSIQKSNRNFQLGLGLGTVQLPEESTPSLRIIEVSPTFQKVLGLKPGLHLAKVNGDRCNKNDIQSVHKHMDAAFPMLSLECIAAIVKKKKGEPKPVVHIEVPKDEEKEQGEVGVRVVACIVRPESFLDLGITFKQDVENGRLLIEAVASHGLFGSTGLGPNQKLVKINGKKISKRKLDQALELLKQVKGRITLEAESIAQNPEPSAERQIFSIQKPNKNFQLGLGFGVEQHDDKRLLRIFKASPTLERVLGLKQGLQLVKVNGASVNIDDLQSVNDQLDEAFPILTLECMASFERTVMRGIHRVDSDLTEAMSVNPEDEARRLKEEQEARAKDQEERVKAQEEERLAAEAEAKAAEEARLKAEEEARLKAEEEARLKEEARIKSEQEEEARRKAEEEAIKAAEEARRKAEEEAKAAEEARLEAEEEARLKAEEEARVKAEEEARRKAEEEARAAEEARIAAEEAARRTAEEEARLRAEARIKAEEEEEARRKSIIEEEEARRKAEEEAIKAAEEASRKAEEEAKARAEEEFRLKTEEAARRAAAQEAREQAQEESRLKAYRASKVRAEEEAKLWEEASIKAEAEAKLAEAEETKKKEKREKRIAANKEMQKNKFASSGDSGFGFFSSGLGEPLIKVKEKTNEDDDLAPAPDSSGNDEIDDLIRQAEERQRQIEQELLDLAWD